jgi:hypothetical protein
MPIRNIDSKTGTDPEVAEFFSLPFLQLAIDFVFREELSSHVDDWIELMSCNLIDEMWTKI